MALKFYVLWDGASYFWQLERIPENHVLADSVDNFLTQEQCHLAIGEIRRDMPSVEVEDKTYPTYPRIVHRP